MQQAVQCNASGVHCACIAAGELGALEEVVGQLTSRGLLRPMTLKALWLICSNAHDKMLEYVSPLNKLGLAHLRSVYYDMLHNVRHNDSTPQTLTVRQSTK